MEPKPSGDLLQTIRVGWEIDPPKHGRQEIYRAFDEAINELGVRGGRFPPFPHVLKEPALVGPVMDDPRIVDLPECGQASAPDLAFVLRSVSPEGLLDG